jgi:hypothetical protein
MMMMIINSFWGMKNLKMQFFQKKLTFCQFLPMAGLLGRTADGSGRAANLVCHPAMSVGRKGG